MGYMIAIWIIVPQIDVIYNRLTEKNDGEANPEYRLPIANIGAVLIPASLFWFAWTVQAHRHWFVTTVSTVFFGLGQLAVQNSIQNYYIDAFQRYAASAIAAGAVFRSLFGGVIPLFAPALFQNVGYGWGISVFAFASLLLSPSPLLFQRYGEWIRTRYVVKL